MNEKQDTDDVTPQSLTHYCQHPRITLHDLKYLTDHYFPVEYVLKKHYNFTEKDYKDYVKMCKREAKLKWQLAHIEANGCVPKDN